LIFPAAAEAYCKGERRTGVAGFGDFFGGPAEGGQGRSIDFRGGVSKLLGSVDRAGGRSRPKRKRGPRRVWISATLLPSENFGGGRGSKKKRWRTWVPEAGQLDLEIRLKTVLPVSGRAIRGGVMGCGLFDTFHAGTMGELPRGQGLHRQRGKSVTERATKTGRGRGAGGLHPETAGE